MPLAMFTGGSSWFVREAARNLIAEGWQVALTDINLDGVKENVEAIEAGAAASVDHLDVTDIAAVRKYADGLAEKHGTIDALINVAGGSNFLQMERPPFHETDPADWQKILAPNLYGTLNCCHSVIPHMVKARQGAIVNLASGMGLRGKANWSIYCVAKAGIVRLTQSLCQELGQHNIRANSIAPGSAECRWMPDVTSSRGGELPPIGERTSAKDVGDAIHYLISDRGKHVTGICLDLSGGSTMH
jgi:NAD(P)-dependent dehydrogenase (short-subunit alcohol dehydrogenase family)